MSFRTAWITKSEANDKSSFVTSERSESVNINVTTGLKIKLDHLVMGAVHLLSIDNINKGLIERQFLDWRHVESVDIIPEMNFILLSRRFILV